MSRKMFKGDPKPRCLAPEELSDREQYVLSNYVYLGKTSKYVGISCPADKGLTAHCLDFEAHPNLPADWLNPEDPDSLVKNANRRLRSEWYILYVQSGVYEPPVLSPGQLNYLETVRHKYD